MIPMDVLLELSNYAFEPRNSMQWCKSAPATSASLKRIYDELRIVIPPDLVLLSQHCEFYGCWFASIGEDYSNHSHIIKLNKLWHQQEHEADNQILPPHLVIINHGYDGDCDCFDLSDLQNGEHPVVYHSAGSVEQTSSQRFTTFRDYLEHLCRFMAPRYSAKKRGKNNFDNPEQAESERLQRQYEKERNRKVQKLLAPYSPDYKTSL